MRGSMNTPPTPATESAHAARLRALGHTVNLPGDRAAGGRGSSHVWGNLQTVEWNRATGVLSGGSDPRNDVGEAKVEPAAR